MGEGVRLLEDFAAYPWKRVWPSLATSASLQNQEDPTAAQAFVQQLAQHQQALAKRGGSPDEHEKQAVDPRKYKTRMCRNWETKGALLPKESPAATPQLMLAVLTVLFFKNTRTEGIFWWLKGAAEVTPFFAKQMTTVQVSGGRESLMRCFAWLV